MHLPRPSRFHLAAFSGVVLLVALALYYGLDGVTQAFAEVGWGIALVVIVRFGQVAFSGVAWQAVLLAPTAWWVCPLLRWVREAINVLLPVAQVGGDIVGARLLARQGVKGPVAAASVLADLLVQVSTQLVFSLLGLGLFLVSTGDGETALWLGASLLLFAFGVIGFFVLQRWGGIGWVERRIVAAATKNGWSVPGGIVGLADSLAATHRAPGRLAVAAAIHMGIWIFGALEVWIVLAFLGHPIGFAEALVIESLSHAARGALFIVPGGVGVQEAAIVAIAAAYGLPPQLALAVGLVKRVPDLVLGIPGLAIWQALEFGRLRPVPVHQGPER
ncbi:flippase-like domain-containing protein [Labrys wisconsinensis]|uniref:Membrane protein n=1 Tax=Labrys wisconsinensis TaxID=425677 RepID=A0ABU0JBP3_9HYPH|nr:flippase-like domain-containing protein [Labrys wisconsinensis]MDQ0470567.1 putative membrane protein [Labrys wisconsinensis]